MWGKQRDSTYPGAGACTLLVATRPTKVFASFIHGNAQRGTNISQSQKSVSHIALCCTSAGPLYSNSGSAVRHQAEERSVNAADTLCASPSPHHAEQCASLLCVGVTTKTTSSLKQNFIDFYQCIAMHWASHAIWRRMSLQVLQSSCSGGALHCRLIAVINYS